MGIGLQETVNIFIVGFYKLHSVNMANKGDQGLSGTGFPNFNIPGNGSGNGVGLITQSQIPVTPPQIQAPARQLGVPVQHIDIGGLVSMVPYFSGENNTTSIRSFMRSLETAGELGHWTDAHKTMVLRQRVMGAGADYLKSNPQLEFASWPQLKEVFITWFAKKPEDEDPLRKFYETTQRPGETAKVYLTRLKIAGLGNVETGTSIPSEEIMMTRNLVNKVLVRTFLKGLSDESGGAVIYMNKPGTIEDALALAEEFEQRRQNRARVLVLEKEVTTPFNTTWQHFQQPQDQHASGWKSPVAEVRTPGSSPMYGTQRQEITCYRCGGKGHVATNCGTPAPRERRDNDRGRMTTRTSSSQVTCNYCKRVGHVISECRAQGYNANYSKPADTRSTERDNRERRQESRPRDRRDNSRERRRNDERRVTFSPVRQETQSGGNKPNFRASSA